MGACSVSLGDHCAGQDKTPRAPHCQDRGGGRRGRGPGWTDRSQGLELDVVDAELGLVDDEELRLVVVELHSGLAGEGGGAPRWRLDEPRLPLLPPVHAPHADLRERRSGTTITMDELGEKRRGEKETILILISNFRRNAVTWASAPEETRTFIVCENARPVIFFWWPLSLVFT